MNGYHTITLNFNTYTVHCLKCNSTVTNFNSFNGKVYCDPCFIQVCNDNNTTPEKVEINNLKQRVLWLESRITALEEPNKLVYN